MLIVHGTLVTQTACSGTTASSLGVIQDGALRVRAGEIVEMGPTASLPPLQGDKVLDAQGMLIMPGLVDGHGHSPHALARGIVGNRRRGLWHAFEQKLDYAALRAAAMLRAVEAIRHGVTSLVDQISAPSNTPFALDAVAEAYTQAGLRACLSTAVSQEHSNVAAQAAIHENARFCARVREEPLLRGVMGIDTCLRISDQVLGAAFRAGAMTGMGYHINLGAYPGEMRDGRLEYDRGSVLRLKRLGMLGPSTLLALHERLPEPDLELLRDTGTFLVHGVGSVLASGLLGRTRPPDFDGEWERNLPTMLGSDQGPPDMIAEVQSAYRLAVNMPGEHTFESLREMLARSSVRGSQYVGGAFKAKLGTLEPGARADLTMLRYVAAETVTAENWPQHLLFGLNASQVDTVLVDGRVLLRGRRLTTLDEVRILAQARETIARLET